ncbi:MAG TPA: UDP-N-acetylmuramate dehydrogenase [Solirubrobacteraceae bacterium]|nr:UDP-N-acetylmuramate dehydrogenase [Solirubrobacteraceae bacterium]
MPATPLRELTTLGLGGEPARLVEAATDDELVAAVRAADEAGEPLLVLAGGSNVVAADDGFAGAVALVRTRGLLSEGTRLEVAAGEPWDDVVAACVADGLAGVECLSGIPGSTGATPIQNVGAYGQEVAETIVSVRAWDRRAGEPVVLPASACGFGYRTSALKREPGRWLVLGLTLALERSALSGPIRYAELARALGVPVGDRAPLGDVRDAVLALRRAKGMVLDPADLDTRSAGSFFTNPVLDAAEFEWLRRRAPEPPPAWPAPDGRVKTSAAWLIERAGFRRGHGDPGGIAISSKHTLALTNRGAGTAAELLALAREIAAGVRDAFGVELEPEPVLVGLDWP